MKVAELNTKDDWFRLVKDRYGERPGSSFIAASERGWEQCQRQFARAQIVPTAGAADLPAVIMGVPVRIVTDIADDDIELRTWPGFETGSPAIVQNPVIAYVYHRGESDEKIYHPADITVVSQL
jgi:hypothetical protein